MEQNEILEETRRTNELLRGQLLWTRVAAALLAVLLVLLLWLLFSNRKRKSTRGEKHETH